MTSSGKSISISWIVQLPMFDVPRSTAEDKQQ